jgi:hypothetical protein
MCHPDWDKTRCCCCCSLQSQVLSQAPCSWYHCISVLLKNAAESPCAATPPPLSGILLRLQQQQLKTAMAAAAATWQLSRSVYASCTTCSCSVPSAALLADNGSSSRCCVRIQAYRTRLLAAVAHPSCSQRLLPLDKPGAHPDC